MYLAYLINIYIIWGRLTNSCAF